VLAPEGWPFVFGGAAFAIVVALLWPRGIPLAALGLLFALFSLWFFRNPDRTPPPGPGVIVSPADGRIVYAGECPPGRYAAQPGKKISVFMSPLDVHVNRAPVTAILGAAAALKEGDVKYTPTEGIPALRQAIVRYTEENYGRQPTVDNVIVSNGAKQAIWNLLFSILNPQDEVIVLAPYWVSYPEMIRMMHGVPVIVKPEDGGFVPRLEEIERVVGSYTRAIIVNSPNNPTGAVYPRELIRGLVELCEKKGIWFISDDIYHKLIFDGAEWPSPYQFTQRSLEDSKVVSVNGGYAMP